MIAAAMLALATQVQILALAVQPQPSPQLDNAASRERQTFAEIAIEAKEAWSENHDEDAIRLCRQGLTLHPEWDDGLWYLGTIFYAQESYREARDQLRHYLARNPQKGTGWALVGMSDYKLREYAHAGEDLQRALALGFQGRQDIAGPAYYYSALLFTRESRFDESAAYLYHLRRGDAGLHVEATLDVPMGLNALRYAMLPEELPPDRVDLARQVGTAVFARYEERRDEARTILSRLVKEYPDEEGVHFQYGLILLEDRAAEGVDEMKRALELSPSDPEPRLSLAQYYLDRNQFDQAGVYADAITASDPASMPAHLLKGQIAEASGQASTAITEFETARKLAPTNNRVLWDLARAYNKAGRKAEAAEVVKELEKLGPEKQ